MKKESRQALIRQLINEHTVETQEDLSQLLKERGVQTTQATISRDIRELNIVKTHNKEGKTYYTIMQQSLFQRSNLSNEEKLAETVAEVSVSLTQVEFMNILTTVPGNAHAIAVIVDKITFPEIVGSLAGDDTILFISRNKEEAKKIYDYFFEKMYY